MKKVMALVLAVMMMATVAFAAVEVKHFKPNRPIATVAPGGNIQVSKEAGVQASKVLNFTATSSTSDTFSIEFEQKLDNATGAFETVKDTGRHEVSRAGGPYVNTVEDMIFRSVNTDNYSISNVKVTTGRNLVKGVEINDKEERVEVKFVDDLNNTTARSWDLSFTLRGKGKMILRSDELDRYNEYTTNTKATGDRVTIPSVKFKMSGTVGYGKVEVNLGDTNDEDLEDIGDTKTTGISLEDDVIKFKNGGTFGEATRVSGKAQAGSFVADAILTEHYDESFTLEGRVYHNDVLYLNVDNDPDRDIIGRLADSDADMDFYVFNSDKNFTTLNSNAKLYFNDAEEGDFVYQIKDQKLIPVGAYDEDEGCWVHKTRVLGAYVVSDVELKEFEATGTEANPNPDTGANDVVGIAAALAAVALVSAAAVSLKK